MDIDLRINTTDLKETEKAELCHRAVQTLEGAVGKISLMYREIGKLLNFMKTSKLYKHYSSDVKTWSQFIRSVNIGFGVGEADHLVRVSQEFEQYLNGRDVRFRRLLDILPVVNDENREDLLNSAESLPASGWNDCVRELKGKQPTDTCEHLLEQEAWARCCTCGKWLKL